jgi:hypothetical protein
MQIQTSNFHRTWALSRPGKKNMNEPKSEAINDTRQPGLAPATCSASYVKCGCGMDCPNLGTAGEPCWGEVEAYYQQPGDEENDDMYFHFCQGHKGQESFTPTPYQPETPNNRI